MTEQNKQSSQPFAWYWHDEDGSLFIEVVRTETTPADAQPLYATEQNKQSDTPAPETHVMPIASWREQSAFEAWAKGNRYEMHQHPLHYQFMDKQTNAARQGWKAALQFTREIQQSLPETSSKEADLPVLTEASLPTTSRLSQLEARTSCAASDDYASATTQPNQFGSSGGETRVRNAQITTAAKSPTETATAKRYEPNLDSPKEGQPDEGVGVPKQLFVYGTPPVKSDVRTRR